MPTSPHNGGVRRTSRPRLAAGLLIATGVLALVVVAGIAVGARPIAPATIWSALTAPDPALTEHRIVWDLRLPRTLLGVLVGAALGLSGAILQGATRNPLADPGILGIHAGAALAVVFGITFFGLGNVATHIWLAFAGAGISMAIVYAVASLGREGATPVKLALAGAAVTAALVSITNAFLLTSQRTLDEMRFWQVGSLAGRHMDILVQVAPFLVVGIGVALCCGRLLDGLALGADLARGLGQRVGQTRAVLALVAVLLAGAATAGAGPIAFVALTVPHVARAITGPSYRWVLAYSAVLAPILLLGADILGRVIAPPGEVQVGIVTAALGAPFFIALIRRRKLAEL